MSATMSLLMGGKKAEVSIPDLSPKPEVATAPAVEKPTVDQIKKMKSADLQKAYEAFAMEVEDWDAMNVAQKKDVLTQLATGDFEVEGEADGEVNEADQTQSKADPSQEDEAGEEEPSEADALEDEGTVGTEAVPSVPVAEQSAEGKADQNGQTEIVASVGNGKVKKAKQIKQAKEFVEAIALAAEASEDLIVQTVAKVSAIKDANAALIMVKSLVDEHGFNEFVIGGYLSTMFKNDWKLEYPTFKAMLEAETPYKLSKAHYLIRIYDGLVEANVAWSKVKDVGWSKLKEIVKVMTAETADQWIELAKALPVIALIEQVKAAIQAAAAGSGPQIPSATMEAQTKSKSFKLHKDQLEVVVEALTKAKDASATEHDPVALTNICLDYLAGGTKKPTVAPVKAAEEGLGISLLIDGVTSKGDMTSTCSVLFEAIKKKWGADAAVQYILDAFNSTFPEVELSSEE